MISKKTASSKRALLPRAADYTKSFLKDWKRLSRSGRYDMNRLKEAMLPKSRFPMRINQQEKNAILDSARETFGSEAEVWLFGSRVDDKAKGGDIDLYIEVPSVDSPVNNKISFKLLLEDRIGEQKVDVVLHQRCNEILPIHGIAKAQGIRLV